MLNPSDLTKSVSVGLEWDIAESVATSPLHEDSPEQILLLPGSMSDGSIEAEITPLEGVPGIDGAPKKECSIIVRASRNCENAYSAGFGGFNKKFFIARMFPGDWELLAEIGSATNLKYGVPYTLRVDCVGDVITLHVNGNEMLSVKDANYTTGRFGLRARKTAATFANINVAERPLRCFVIMPFKDELEPVYKVLEQTVKKHGMECIRADQRFISRPAVDEIRDQIKKSDFVIVDFTGKNPNVYYEAGIADALGKRWIVLAQDIDHDLAFDVRHIRTIPYSNSIGAAEGLEDKLTQAIEAVRRQQQ